MQITAKIIAQMLGGTIEGDPEALVTGPSKIEEGTEGTITFLANPKYEAFAYTTKASVMLVAKDFEPTAQVHPTLIRVDDVYASLAMLMERFGQSQAAPKEGGVSQQAAIHGAAKVHADAYVGPYVIVEEGAEIGAGSRLLGQVYVGKNAKIGTDCTLHPGVRIYQECLIGDRCIIHANAVIGSDGFGFAPQADGSFKKIPQLGNVILESDVEIGANTVIDRATMGSTRIKQGAKLDNLIQIAHNVEVGSGTAIAAQAGVAGSTKIGDRCLIGGQAGFVGHIQVANGSRVQAQSGVAVSIDQEGSAVYGSPAIPYRDYLRSYAVFKQLPDLLKRLQALEKTTKP